MGLCRGICQIFFPDDMKKEKPQPGSPLARGVVKANWAGDSWIEFEDQFNDKDDLRKTLDLFYTDPWMKKHYWGKKKQNEE